MAANRVVGCEHPQPITPSPRVALKRKFPGDHGLPVQLRTAAALNTAQNLAANRSQPVGWASYAKATPVQDVRINHRRAYIGMPQQLLHRADVIPGLQQVCGERMPEDMTAHPLRYACPTRSLRDGSLHDGLVQVIPRRGPNRGSRQMRPAGNTNCHRHSAAAFGYFRLSASGITTRPSPAARSR